MGSLPLWYMLALCSDFPHLRSSLLFACSLYLARISSYLAYTRQEDKLNEHFRKLKGCTREKAKRYPHHIATMNGLWDPLQDLPASLIYDGDSIYLVKALVISNPYGLILLNLCRPSSTLSAQIFSKVAWYTGMGELMGDLIPLIESMRKASSIPSLYAD